MTPEVAEQVMGYDEAKRIFWMLFKTSLEYNLDPMRISIVKCYNKGVTIKMSEYLSIMMKFHDNLHLAGYLMDMLSFNSYVIGGLDDEYTHIVCVIRNQDMSCCGIQSTLVHPTIV